MNYMTQEFFGLIFNLFDNIKNVRIIRTKKSIIVNLDVLQLILCIENIIYMNSFLYFKMMLSILLIINMSI